jgi:DNA polymerase-3 subunit beta
MAKAQAPTGILTVERSAIVAALTQASKAVENRNTYPILANVLLSADADKLTIRATDLDIEITTSAPASGKLPTTTAPAKMLLDIAKRLPAGAEITLAVEDEHLVVKSGRSRFKVATIDPEAFPELKQPAYTTTATMDLAALVAPVTFAMSDEETRYYLRGVFLHTSDGRLRAVATDGHRLAAVYGPELALAEGIIVPRKTVGLIPEGSIQVDIGEGRIRFTAGDTVIVSKLVEGSFPDYERVIPKNNDKPVVLDRKALSSAVERVGVFASERGGKAVRLEIAPGQVVLSVTGEGGQASDEIASDYEGEPFEIGYNASYLSELLRVVEGDSVTFEIRDAGSPARVVGGNPDWCGVLMPMRVNGRAEAEEAA